MEKINSPTRSKIISRAQASVKYQRSPTTMWRDEREGLIPPATRIRNRKFWIEAELDAAYLGEKAESVAAYD
jgi:hypothetical protein